MATNQPTDAPTSGRRPSNRGAFVLGNTLIVLGLVLLVAILFGRSWFGWGVTRTETISQDLGTAEQADIVLTSGVNTLQVREGSSDKLITGEIDIGPRERLEQNFEMNGDTAVFRLESKRAARFLIPFGTDEHIWTLALTPAVPLALTVETGVGEVQLDLSQLTVTTLELSTGVGATTVELPATGQVKASVDVGVGGTTIRIPSGMAARIEADAGLGNVNVSGDFEREGDVYRSSDYDTAQNRVDLKVNGGIGQVNVASGP